MNSKGNNWCVLGKKNTGKTVETMALASFFNDRLLAPKRLIVYDHTNNSSYRNITEVIPVQRLAYQLPERAIVKVQEPDFDLFLDYVINYVRNAVVILDDCGLFFRSNVTGIRLAFLKSCKNNGNEYFFQCHSVREVGPLFLESMDMFVLKQTRDDGDLPPKIPGRNRIEPLFLDIAVENAQRPSGEKWATRVYDLEEDVVWVKDLRVESDDVFDTYTLLTPEEYFQP